MRHLPWHSRLFPQSEYLKNVYAYFCWKAADRARLREALPPVRANPDM